ncbi:YCF48-related protein [Mariniblastus fucicola]|uniref:Ycf48-like protein n=1 Tax=Mariniblastus fucicola TaxID=980251 RepID=A0A5B9PFB6_9BACT|nr:YCF48-related protein [Mariniblastus fucicola]QEG25108.1 Ycf48-like protein [Mariniblastus fucicola]
MPRTDSVSCALFFALAVLALTKTTAIAAIAAQDGLAQEPRPESWKADASLTDVIFVDRQHGWAVGSQGVLLRTEDGGKTWGEGSLTSRTRKTAEIPLTEKFQRIRANQQHGAADTSTSSPFSCRFETVCFTDAKNGWAAGGYDLPYMDHSRAVIARTNDGGKSWQSLPHLMLGRIQKIEFRGMQRLSGWAVGANDPGTDSSLSFTADAGNLWNSQKSKRMPDLIDAETTGNQFVGLDSDGQPVSFDTAKLEHSVITEDGNFVLDDVAMVDAKTGWAVGHNGAVLQTKNGGLSWSKPSQDLDPLQGFDFRCVATQKTRIWFAGNPGNTIFSIDQQTGEWDAHRLPGGTAVNSIYFLDETFGWAVGDLGKIWATQDGGNNWTLQRSGSQRGKSSVGVLAFCNSVDELPLEFLAKQAGEDGKLVGVAMPRSENFDTIRMAAERLGAAVVSPLSIDSESDLIRKLVRTIRIWRPTVIAGHSSQFLERAVRLAADDQAFPEQLATGLNPWQTRFLMVADPNGPLEYENSVFLTRVGSLLEDFVLPSRMICRLPISAKNRTAFFAWKFVGHGADARRVQLDSSPFSQTSVAKRKQNATPLGSLASVGKISGKRGQMTALLQRRIDSVLDVESCKKAISNLTFPLNADPNGQHLAGIWLVQLADQYFAAGRPQLAAWTLENLTRNYPNHCMAPLAHSTLAKYYSSSELNRLAISDWQRLRQNIGQANRLPAGTKTMPQGVAIQQKRLGVNRTEYRWDKVDLASALEEAAAMPLDIDVEDELKDFDPATVDLSLDVAEPEVDPTTQQQNLAPMNRAEIDAFLKERNRLAASQFSRLGARDRGLVKRADLQYLQAHIVKQLSGIEDANPYYRNVLKAKPHPKFSPAASDELRSDNESLSTAVIATAERPHLDGLPDDPVWQEVMKANQTIKLEKPEGALMNDIVMLARDAEYVYLYARCYKADQCTYTSSTGDMRQRDADLTNQDRIEISLDVDRDLASSCLLKIDWRGRVHESCSGANSWNPKMFVANHQDERVWSIECAIRIEDLTESIEAGEIWRFDVQRAHRDANASVASIWGPDQRPNGSLLMFR